MSRAEFIFALRQRLLPQAPKPIVLVFKEKV